MKIIGAPRYVYSRPCVEEMPARDRSLLGRYLGAVLRHGYVIWKRADDVTSPIQIVLQLVGILFFSTVTWAVHGFSKPDLGPAVVIGAALSLIIAFGVLGPYRAWSSELLRANDLSDRLKPEIEVREVLVADSADHTRSGTGTIRVFVRCLVATKKDAELSQCAGHLLGVSIKDQATWRELWRGAAPCWWAEGGDPACQSAIVRPNVPQYLNIASARQSTTSLRLRAEIGIDEPTLAMALNQPGLYRFDVAISAKDTPTINIACEIDATRSSTFTMSARSI